MAYVVTAGAALGINVIVGRRLGPGRFGDYSYFIWIVRTTVWLLLLGIPPALIRAISESHGAGDQAGAKGIYSVASRYQLFLMPTLLTVTAGWSYLKSGDVALSFALAVAAALLGYVWLYEQALGGLLRYDLVARNSAIVAGSQILVVSAIAVLGGGLREFLFYYAALAVVTFAVWQRSISRLMRSWDTAEVPSLRRLAFRRLARTMAVVQLSDNILWGRPEIFFIDHWWSNKHVGWYSAALVLQTLTVYLPHIASRVLTPEFASMRGGGQDEELQRVFPSLCIYISLFALPLGIGGAVMAADVLALTYGAAYAAAAPIAAILMVGGALVAIAGPASSAAFTGPNPGFMAKLAASLALVNVILDLILIRPFGPVGAAAATISSQCIAVIISISYVRRRMGLRYPWGGITKIALAAVVAPLLSKLATASMEGSWRLMAVLSMALAVYFTIILMAKVIEPRAIAQVIRSRRGPPSGHYRP